MPTPTGSLDSALSKLRERYLHADPSAIAQIEKWETETRRLIKQMEYAEHEMTQRIVAFERAKVQNIDVLLANDRKLTDLERATLFERKDAAQWYLSLFDIKTLEEQLESIEKAVSYELKDDDEE